MPGIAGPYATAVDVGNLGYPQQAFVQLTADQMTECTNAASDQCDTFFRGRWGYDAVPLLVWDFAVRLASARIAAFLMINVRGYKADSSADKNIKSGYDMAIEWLDQVQRQQKHPLVTLANNTSVGGAQPICSTFSVVDLSTGATGTNRGW